MSGFNPLRGVLWAVLACFLLTPYAWAYGPYNAEFVRNYDADTVTLRYQIYIDTYLEKQVRLEGVDTPEKGWRAQCQSEKELAQLATDYVRGLLSNAVSIQLTVSKNDKFGRPLGTLVVDGVDLADDLIASGYGRKYDGGKRKTWC